MTLGHEPRFWLLIPTYDEAENVAGIVEAALAHLPPGGRVLVIDDASPDGTGRIADELAARHDRVEVLHRERKEGLGPAYVAGYREALARGADLVAQMDADFSHEPGELPELIAATADADLVLGSRYVPGGRVENWGRLRRAISRGGSAYARRVLGLSVRDLTGGFKVFRRHVLESIELETLASQGYSFQVETTYRAVRAGFTVEEVPITFVERRVGQSKMSRSIVAEAAWRVPAMRRRAGEPGRAARRAADAAG